MHYFSGFSLQKDNIFFKSYLDPTAYTVAGFSYGAIKAFEFALTNNSRIDKLQLFSPAFFQDRSEDFKQTQLRQYKANKKLYLKYFMQNCFKPYVMRDVTHVDTQEDELQEILWYQWEADKFRQLKQKNIDIEVYLAEQDNIINAQHAKEFFVRFSTVYFIKNANHFLLRS